MHSPSFLGLAQGLSSCEYVYLSEDCSRCSASEEYTATESTAPLNRHNSVSESLCQDADQGAQRSEKKSHRGSWTPVLRSKHSSISDIRKSSDVAPSSPSKASLLLARFRRNPANSSSAVDLRGNDVSGLASGRPPTDGSTKGASRTKLFRHISWSNDENVKHCDNGCSPPSSHSSLSVFDSRRSPERSPADDDVGERPPGGASKSLPTCASCYSGSCSPGRCQCKPPIMKIRNVVQNGHQRAGSSRVPLRNGSNQVASPGPPGRSKLSPVKDILRRFSLRYRRKQEAEREETPEKPRPHSFVNSQEWTLARSVPDLKLGILGTTNSGKSALVHRYLTGSYMQDESPEGGRFKKEVIIDTQSYLLLIRDEGGAPEMQFTNWVDAVVCVFSVENEMSFNAIYTYYTKMAHYRNLSEIPVILVGTQDAISESNPRVIDDARARKLANDLKRCSYYETCATYGLNVERVFQDACQKIVQMRMSSLTPNNSRPTTPNHSTVRAYYTNTPTNKAYDTHSSSGQSTSGSGTTGVSTATLQNIQGHSPPFREQATPPQISHVPVSHPTMTASHSEEKKKDKQEKKREKEREKQLEREREQAAMAAMIQSQLQGHSHSQGQAQNVYMYQDVQNVAHKHSHASPIPVSIPIPPPTTAPPPPPTSVPGMAVDPMRIQNTPEMFQLQQQLQQQLQLQQLQQQQQQQNSQVLDFRDMPSPGSTPVPSRKAKKNHIVQKSNSFSPDAGSEGQTHGLTPLLNRKEPRYRFSLIVQKKGEEEKRQKNGEMVGSGRVIPIKQGYLYKKSAKPLSKDWKKKYVTLLDDGRLTYHPSLHDYMDDVHGKEISLMHTTVKIPGQKPRGSRTQFESQAQPNGNLPAKVRDKDAVVLTGYDQIRDVSGAGSGAQKTDDSVVISNSSLQPDTESGLVNDADVFIATNLASRIETPNVKKRHRRAKSGAKNLDTSQDGADSDGYEFMIVSMENKQWHFEACSIDEREEWVTAIEQQILLSLQGVESNKSKSRSNTLTDPAAGQAIRSVKGNHQCADCDAPNPDWASLNLGALICIECSGIHRNLGTHLSRVRSLDLDEWPPELVDVMKSMGNQLVNSIWEANMKGKPKPTPTSSREDKEKWIRAKYEQKEFLPPTPHQGVPLPQQLIDAVARQHIHDTALVLAHCKLEHVNAPYSMTDTRTALHIAAALGNVVLVQLLLWYGANVKIVDHEGRNALFYARSSTSPECVELLKGQGCPENPTLPRRRGSSQPSHSQQKQQQQQQQQQQQAQQPQPQQQPQQNSDVFEKLPASII